MRRDIAALRRRLGTTTIYVTHDQVEGMTLGDRIVVMRDGRVQQIDTPLALYRRPANTFVATFLGTPPRCLRARGGDRAAGQRDTGLAGRFRRSGSRVVRLVIVSVAPEALHWFDGERETRQPS